MKTNLLALLILIAGFVFSYFYSSANFAGQDFSHYKFEAEEMKGYDSGFLLLDIFLTNLTVGILLSILGLLTSGIVTILLLFYNGYLLGVIYFVSVINMPPTEILYHSKHIPIELFAFVLFAKIGFSGFAFYQKIIRNKISFDFLPSYKKFILPIILLFIASFIEVI